MGGGHGFGVDVGGSGIKGCAVDLDTGQLIGERLRIPTPQPSTPAAIADVVCEVVGTFDWSGNVGITLPCVIKRGRALTAANVDPAWLDTDAEALFGNQLGERDVVVLNDADAAGLAEVRFGAGRGVRGVVLLLTFGTGIGSALFVEGRLVPNTEFGHIEVDGRDGEDAAAASARDEDDLSWQEWAQRVTRYLRRLETVVWPDLIIAGGGVSRKAEKWLPLLQVRSTVVPAQLRNDAGIVGAALAAADGIRV